MLFVVVVVLVTARCLIPGQRFSGISLLMFQTYYGVQHMVVTVELCVSVSG